MKHGGGDFTIPHHKVCLSNAYTKHWISLQVRNYKYSYGDSAKLWGYGQ